MPRALAPVALAAALALLAAPVRADDKQACIAASEDAQQLRIDGKLLAARARLLECARPECPAIVRQDCAQWMADVVASLPTVVLGARGPDGHDVLAVKASMDGIPVTARLDGRPVPVDPGAHVFRFESSAGETAEAEVLVRAGEKNREITVTLGGARPPLPPAPAPSAPSSGVPPLAWISGGVALAALGTALAFDVAQGLDYSHLHTTCAGHCAPSDVNHVATERWIAGVTAGVGVLALGAAIYFYLARPSSAHTAAAPLRIDVTSMPGGAASRVTVEF